MSVDRGSPEARTPCATKHETGVGALEEVLGIPANIGLAMILADELSAQRTR